MKIKILGTKDNIHTTFDMKRSVDICFFIKEVERSVDGGECDDATYIYL